MKSTILRLPVEPKDTEEFLYLLLKVCLAACAVLWMLWLFQYSVRSMIKEHSVRIVIVNQEALFKEKAFALAKLSLKDAELKKQLSDFKAAFKQALSKLPPHYVVVNTSSLLRTDNVTDVTPQILAWLTEREPS